MNVLAPVRHGHDLRVDIGFASETGKRENNEDYVAACLSGPAPGTRRDVVAAIADGVGGHKGGREASETAVRAFLDGYYNLPQTLGVQRAAGRALDAANSWIAAQGRADPELASMGCTFTALILSRRSGHIAHVGDTRAYRLNAGGFERLTVDHTMGRGDLSHALNRAVGFEDNVRIDHATFGLHAHDRFLLCSDGVHGSLRDARLRELLDERASPEETAREIVEAALQAGSSDNVSAIVVDILDIPPAQEGELSRQIADLPILKLPAPGLVVDDFRLDEVISDGRYSRLIRSVDQQTGATVVLKFPHPRVADDASYRLAFINEAWVAARVRSPWIGEVIELPPGRQTRLYSVMPFYDGETLLARIKRGPRLDLAEGVQIATRLSRAIATLHRSGVIHRDIKPDNVILTRDGGLRLVDLGVARVPQLEDFPSEHIPGTPSYMAPELFRGEAGDELSDLYALGVTLYRAFSGGYPYGEIEPFTRPKFGKPAPLTGKRPDLPAWLDAVLSNATAAERADRYGDVLEFAFEIENGAARTRPTTARRKSLYERNPVVFWQAVTAVLFAALVVMLVRR